MQHLSPRRLRSFIRRDSRQTKGQKWAKEIFWPNYGLDLKTGLLNQEIVFSRLAPLFLEIGFGTGISLLALAKENPDKNFIGIETHQPGVGKVLQQLVAQSLSNVRLYQQDAVEVVESCLLPDSLSGTCIFFPDPWPKRRHHMRRLIQPPFMAELVSKIKIGGILHLATDWEDYASHMMKVMTPLSALTNDAGRGNFATHSLYRPVFTKFEQRALKEGRKIWELQFTRIK